MNVDLPAPHTAQRQVIAEASRFNVLSCGRRWGKTKLGIDRAVRAALAGYPVAWYAPIHKDAKEVWREVKWVLRDVTASKNEQEMRLELVTGGELVFWTLENPDSSRGRKYGRVIIDEAAKIAQLEYAWNYTIRPTLSDYRGDAWFLSTPKGRNYFYRLYLRGLDEPGWQSWQMPTSANPHIAAEEIEDARRHLPAQAFEQEYLAAFLEDAGLVFRGVRGATWQPPAKPEPGRRYVIGGDWAQANDFTVFWVVDDLRRVVDGDRFNQLGWDVQRGRFGALYEKWGCDYALLEANSIGGPNIEALQNEGYNVEGFTTTSDSKQAVVVALQLAFERDDIAIPDDPVLIAELESFEATRLPSGRWRYEAPSGMHDDTVISLALALAGCSAYDATGGITV